MEAIMVETKSKKKTALLLKLSKEMGLRSKLYLPKIWKIFLLHKALKKV